jgi:serine/threonine protein kinase
VILPPRYQDAKEFTTAMNILYIAFDTETNQQVVIKIMKGNKHDAVRDQQLRELFQHEIELARYLDHPHILKAVDSGIVISMQLKTSVPYITFPFLKDRSLKDFIDRSPPWDDWSLPQTMDVIWQAADTLEYIHKQYIPISDQLSRHLSSRPLVHRDVKLENFLVRPEHTKKRVVHIFLSDFGIARTQRITGDVTDHTFGTVKYMPPEQFEGRLDPHSDQYSLALMACFLLTGKYPLPIDSLEQAAWYSLYQIHKSELPKRPTQLNPQRIKSTEVDHVILKALSKEPEERYPTIQEFADALSYAIQQQLASVPTVYILQPGSLAPPQEKISQSLLVEPTEPDQDAVDATANKTILTTDSTEMPSEDDWKSLSNIVLESPIEQLLPVRPQMICWSHDGEYLACLFNDHAPIILERQSLQKKVLQVEPGHLACWMSKGYGVVISAQYTMGDQEHSKILLVENVISKLASVSRSSTLATFAVPTIDGMDWSSKGQLAIWISEENSILLYDMSQAPKFSILPQYTLRMEDLECGGIGTLCWSPDGTLLAAGTSNGTLVCWQAGTYMKVWLKSLLKEQVFSLTWSPDSTYLAVSSGDRHITIWNVRNDHLVTEWKHLPMVPRMLSISRQGLLVASSRQQYLYFREIGENSATSAAKHPGTWLAAWSPTRTELATLHPKDDTRLVIWRM